MAKGIDFGKQVGPLPLGAWFVVVGGGLAIAFWQRNQGSSDPEIVEDTGSPDGVGEGGDYSYVPPKTPDNTEPEYASNEAWGTAAINWLIAQGYPPGLASSAITKALAGGVDVEGNKMSVQEWSLWTLALQHLGSPPYPVNVAPPSTVPGPVTPPPEPPPKEQPPPKEPNNKVPPYIEVVAKRGDSISKIASRYGKSWQTVWNFNLKYRSKATQAIMRARGPNLIFAGTRIWVPK